MTSRVDLEEWLTHPLIFCLHSINFKTLGTLLVLAAAYLMRSAGSPASSSNVLSYLIDSYLNWRYPIKSSDGKNDLPTLPYVFPNGQGNEEKLAESAKGQRMLEKKYGKMYRIWSGATGEIVLTRPYQVRAVFKDSNLHLKGENFNQGWLCGQMLGNCLGILNLDNWTRVRGVCTDSFHHSKSQSHVPYMQQRIEKEHRLLRSGKKIQSKQMMVQPSEDLKVLSFKIFCDLIYRDLPESMEFELRDLLKLRETIWLEVTKGGICRFSFSQFLPTATNRTLRLFKSKWEEFNDRAYRRAKSLDPESGALIILLYSALEEGRMHKIEVLHTLDELLFENLDVSLGALAWNMIFLAAHPEVQARLRNEVTQVKQQGSGAWDEYLLGNSNLLMACILESARLKPIVLFTTVQAIPSERVVDGFVVPAGTHFVVDTHALNVSDPYWGKESELYQPDRFLRDRNLTSERYRYFRFGFGPRNCLGKYIIDVFLKLTMAYAVEHFEMELPEGEQLGLDGSKSQAMKFLDLPTNKIIYKEL